MTTFSERHGYSQPKPITFRDDLPASVREPLISILKSYVSEQVLWERLERLFNRYGLDKWPPEEAAAAMRGGGNHSLFMAARSVLLSCQWFRVLDVIEDVVDQLAFYETELSIDPDEEPRSAPLRQEINDYFVYAGVGWQFVGGQILARGDDRFERIVGTAVAELTASARPTAALFISRAIRSLSLRPKPDFSAAVFQATNAMECVLGEVTGKSTTLGAYLKQEPALFPGSLKKALDGLWGYASEEGARHGKEGVEPPREEAELIVSIAAAVTTYLNRKHPPR